MKVENPNWQKINCVPVEISLRDVLGISMDKQELDKTLQKAKELLENPDRYADRIKHALSEHFYNQGYAAKAGALYVLNSLQNKKTKGDRS